MATDSELSLDQLIELERRAAERERAGGSNDGSGGDDDADDRGVIVLPWWQRPFNIGVLVVTAAVLAAMVGWMVGDANGGIKHNDADVGFLQDMREHHEQAVYMSLIYGELPGTNPGLRQIAYTIDRGQNIEVGRMIQMLRMFGASEVRDSGHSMDWMTGYTHDIDPEIAAQNNDFGASQMTGMATEAQLDELAASSGEAADKLFVELMTAHHLGGIEMADYEAQEGRNDEVVAMAEAMSTGQRSEISEMEGVLKMSVPAT
jgi:uncharacterized protein (DUF305 family)